MIKHALLALCATTRLQNNPSQNSILDAKWNPGCQASAFVVNWKTAYLVAFFSDGKLKTCPVCLGLVKSLQEQDLVKLWSLSTWSCVKRSSCIDVHSVTLKSCFDAAILVWHEAHESLGLHQPMKWMSGTDALRCSSQSWSEKFS